MKHIIKITLSLLILFTFNGCHKNDMDSLFPNQGEVQEYNLNLSVGEMVAGTNEQLPSTRAISDEISSDIKNLWVIQVSNKDNKIVSTPTYISNYINGVNVKLVPCYDDDSYKIIYIANTFKNNLEIYKGDNLDDIADLVKPIVSEKDCYTTAADSKYHILMGSQTMGSSNTLAECELSYSVAKVTLMLKVNKDLDLLLSSAQMCNVADRLYYFDKGVDKYPVYAELNTINYEADELSDVPVSGDYKTYTLTYYVPVNKRGVVSEATAETKPLYASAKSTYLKIRGKLGEDGVEYKIYLGADLTTDYNILPNNNYKYNVTFNTVGDPTTDMRVNIMSQVDFTKYPSSNCYIVHSDDECDRKYIIPIGERIKRYWVDYEHINQFNIDNDTPMEYDILWYDMDGDLNGVAVTKYNNPGGVAAVQVTIPAGCNDGNFVFGVKLKNGDYYLWSWHIWITDYNPNDYMKYGSEVTNPQKYRYDVTGGEVHNYKTDVEHNNSRYVMDRFLGARSVYVTTSPKGMKGALSYQYGRKDPFPAYDAKKADGTDYSVQNMSKSDGSIIRAIKNPMVFYKQYDDFGNWAQPDEYSGVEITAYNCPWYDIKATGYEKSIFDPSPLGWKLITKSNMFSTKYFNLGLIENVEVGVNSSQPLHYTFTPKDYVSDTGVDYLAVYPRTPYLGSNSGYPSPEVRSLMRFSNGDAMRFNAPAYVGASSISLTSGTGYLAHGFAARCESYPADLEPLNE